MQKELIRPASRKKALSYCKDQKMLRKVSAARAGMGGAIPNSYKASLEAQLATLNEWHARFAKKGSLSPFAL